MIAISKLWFNIRCLACEEFVRWSLRVCPKGYVPSYVEACVTAYRREGRFKDIKAFD